MSFYNSKCNSAWFRDLTIAFIRFWGILTAVVLCVVGIDLLLHYNFMGVYVIVVSCIVLFLEIIWVVPHFLKHYISKENKVLEMASNIKRWKKSLMYLPFSVALLLKPHRMWLSLLAGTMLMFLVFLHFLLSLSDCHGKKKEKSLLGNEEDWKERNEAVIFEIFDNSLRPKEDIPFDEPGENVLDI